MRLKLTSSHGHQKVNINSVLVLEIAVKIFIRSDQDRQDQVWTQGGGGRGYIGKKLLTMKLAARDGCR